MRCSCGLAGASHLSRPSMTVMRIQTLRHIHAICLVQGRLSKEEFAKLKTLWQTATAEVRLQRRMRDRRTGTSPDAVSCAGAGAVSIYPFKTALSVSADASKRGIEESNPSRCSMAAITAATDNWAAFRRVCSFVPAATNRSIRRKRSSLELDRQL